MKADRTSCFGGKWCPFTSHLIFPSASSVKYFGWSFSSCCSWGSSSMGAGSTGRLLPGRGRVMRQAVSWAFQPQLRSASICASASIGAKQAKRGRGGRKSKSGSRPNPEMKNLTAISFAQGPSSSHALRLILPGSLLHLPSYPGSEKLSCSYAAAQSSTRGKGMNTSVCKCKQRCG